MKYSLLLSLPLAFAFGFWAGQWRRCRSNHARRTKSQVNQQIGGLVGYKAVLVEIREGRFQQAIELLEFSADCLVSRLWHRLGEAEGGTRDRMLQFFRDFKAYRQRWPRQPRTEALASEHLSHGEIQEVANEATAILNSV